MDRVDLWMYLNQRLECTGKIVAKDDRGNVCLDNVKVKADVFDHLWIKSSVLNDIATGNKVKFVAMVKNYTRLNSDNSYGLSFIMLLNIIR